MQEKNLLNMMNKLKNSSVKSTCDFYISKELLRMLPEIAREVMEKRPENNNFKENPDDLKEHAERWHQFGIISHTEAFNRSYEFEAQQYFKEWNLESIIHSKMTEQIDGKTKKELLAISGSLHDLGKFARGFIKQDSELFTTYFQHEAKSETLIKESQLVNSLLKGTYNLTEDHIDYIARCAGLHFELGKTRDAVKKTNLGFTMAFANSEECKKVSNEIAIMYPHFKIEIGILFLCDSLAKTDVRIAAKTDMEINQKSKHIDNIIKKRNLNPKLKDAIKQLPVNIEITKMYLKAVC